MVAANLSEGDLERAALGVSAQEAICSQLGNGGTSTVLVRRGSIAREKMPVRDNFMSSGDISDLWGLYHANCDTERLPPCSVKRSIDRDYGRLKLKSRLLKVRSGE